MDYRKLDGALAAALEDVEDTEEPTLGVFIHTSRPPDAVEATFLKKLGITATSGRQVFTATLSTRSVAELSDQPWVSYLKFSRKLRLFDQRQP